MHIVTLTTSHNRCEKTLSSLEDLHQQLLPAGVTIEHVIVDDGSTDGTTHAIKSHFGDVEVLKGSGALYWAGGMRYGWQRAVKFKSFEYLFVYNDDIRLVKDGLQRLLSASRTYLEKGGNPKHVVVGAFKDTETGCTTYSGLNRTCLWHPLRFRKIDPPHQEFVEVETMNMNACLISKSAINEVGFLSNYFIHSGADFEYGLKVQQAGGKSILAAGYFGFCDRNESQDNFISSSTSLVNCYCRLLNLKKEPLKQRAQYYKNHGGFFWVLLFLVPYITLPIKYYQAKMRSDQ